MTGEGSHEEIGQHFSRTNIFVLVPGGKHSTAQGTWPGSGRGL